jgi:protein-S-isoprenylcysteine O-methyltransferase Ste14
MNLHKVFKIVVAILSLAGAIFLAMIVSKGDDAIKAGDAGAVDNMSYIAYITLGLILLFVVFFVVKNLVTHTSSLKSTLIGAGAFAAVLIVAYLLTGGDTTQYSYSEGIATDKQSHLVGAGLVAFYVLGTVAILSMLLSGVKKLIK